jgi:hypothetical protein
MAEKVQKVGVEREPGYLYFIDKQGDVARTLMARGGKKNGKAAKIKKVSGKDKTKKPEKKIVKKSAGKGKKR